MKKLTGIALIALALASCKQETNKTATTATTGQNKTETTTQTTTSTTETAAAAKPAISDSAGVYTQHYKLEQGKTYPFVTTQTDTKTAKMGTQTQSATSNSVDDMSFTVTGVSGGVYDLDINLNAKKTSQTAEGKTVTIDTKGAEPKDEQLKGFYLINKAMMGSKLQMKMKENGEIISITGFDPIYAKVSTAISGLLKDKKKHDGFLQSFKEGFNEKILKEQFLKSFRILPTKGAKIGQSWTESENLTPDGKVKNNTTFTLSKVDGNEAIVTVKGGVPRKSESHTDKGVTQTISVEGTQNGTLKFDVNSGWLKDSNLNTTTTQSQTMSDGKQSQSLTQTSKSTMKIN